MRRPKRVILSFDIDGQRAFGSYEKLDRDIILQEGLPRAVQFLKKHKLDATFFVVGKNILDFPHQHELLGDFDIGNHTYSHPTMLTEKSPEEKYHEISEGHSVIKNFYNRTPDVFRAPDYQIDSGMIETLKGLGYRGDSSMIKVLVPFRYLLNYFQQRKIVRDPIEYPMTSFIIPFNGTSAIFYGLRLTKFIFEFLLTYHDPLIINFHARDFINMQIDRPGFWRRHKSLETTLAFLDYIRARCSVLSFRQHLDSTAP